MSSRTRQLSMFAVLFSCFAVGAVAETPQTILYQGRLGARLDGAIPMQFEIWDAPFAGDLLWTEVRDFPHPRVQVARGDFEVLLGSVNPVPAALICDVGPLYLAIRVQGRSAAGRQELRRDPAADCDRDRAVGGDALKGRDVRSEPFPAGKNKTQSGGGGPIVPAGAVAFFNLPVCPAGWNEVVEARGRYLVGLPVAGTLGAAVGTALSPQENRPVGRHSHSYTPPVQTGTGQGQSSAKVGGANSAQTTEAGTVDGTNAPYLQLLVCQKQ